jgi:UDP-N-acetylglucosamine 4,6-dehydratase/5-epimerase
VNITLQKGVDFVLYCLGKMWGGKLFIPKIPSYNILDVSMAIAPECKHEIIDIRPREKLHEEMITISDSQNTIEFDKYYVIIPAIKQWNKEKFIDKSNEKKR